MSAFSDARIELSDVAFRIKSLANAFARVGNNSVSESLLGYSYDILACSDVMDKEMSNEIYRSFEVAQEHSENILKACLAGVFISIKDRGDDNEQS
jgi:hypothetical protein